jgi:hypothetical protein
MVGGDPVDLETYILDRQHWPMHREGFETWLNFENFPIDDQRRTGLLEIIEDLYDSGKYRESTEDRICRRYTEEPVENDVVPPSTSTSSRTLSWLREQSN